MRAPRAHPTGRLKIAAVGMQRTPSTRHKAAGLDGRRAGGRKKGRSAFNSFCWVPLGTKPRPVAHAGRRAGQSLRRAAEGACLFMIYDSPRIGRKGPVDQRHRSCRHVLGHTKTTAMSPSASQSVPRPWRLACMNWSNGRLDLGLPRSLGHYLVDRPRFIVKAEEIGGTGSNPPICLLPADIGNSAATLTFPGLQSFGSRNPPGAALPLSSALKPAAARYRPRYLAFVYRSIR